jgi:integrase
MQGDGELPVRTRVEPGIYTYTMPSGGTGWEINWQEGGRTRWKRLGAVGIKRAREAREEHRVRARGTTTPAAMRTKAPLVIDYIREVAAALHSEHRPNTRGKWAALTADVSDDPRLLATPDGRAEAALAGHMTPFAGVRLSGDLTDVSAKWLKAMEDPKLVRNRLVRSEPPDGARCERTRPPGSSNSKQTKPSDRSGRKRTRPTGEPGWKRQRGAYDKATRRSYFDIMKVVFDSAVEDGFLRFNPLGLKKTPRPGTSPPRLRILPMDEQTRLLEAARPQHRPLLTVALFTGLRINELLALRWENVDLVHPLIRVTHQMDRGERVPYTKTDAGYREIWISPPLAATLSELRAEAWWNGGEDYVFATRDGGPKDDGNIREDVLYPAVSRAGLNVGRRPKDRVVFHSLRHTYVSMLISDRDISEATIARLVGHSNTLTLRLTYEHLFNQHRDEAEVRQHTGAVLDAVLAGSASLQPVRGQIEDEDDAAQAIAVRRALTTPSVEAGLATTAQGPQFAPLALTLRNS